MLDLTFKGGERYSGGPRPGFYCLFCKNEKPDADSGAQSPKYVASGLPPGSNISHNHPIEPSS